MPVEKIIVGRDREDMVKFGDKGTVFLGKHIVGEGEDAHLTNPIHMDVARPHIVLVCGKRGTGKCVEENTIITLDDGSVIPIKELENNDQKIFGLGNKLKITRLEKSQFYKRKVNRLLYIKLRSGRVIKLTPEHPFLTIKGWVPAKDLKIKSRIATPRCINSFGKESMRECEIKLLAYMIAEGHIRNGLTRFTNNEEIIFSDFKESLEKFDSNLKMVIHRKGSFGISQIKKKVDSRNIKRDENGNFVKGSKAPAKANPLKLWLKKLKIYNKLSIEKIIPKEIFRLPKNQLAVFLNRLFTCDGSIYRHKTTNGYTWEISYSSSSEQLIHQIQHLLLRFGVLSRIRRKNMKCNGKNFESFEIVIQAVNTEKFIREIGFFGKKKERERKCLKELSKKVKNPNVDVIPKDIWDVYRSQNWVQIGREIGYSIPKSVRTSVNYGPSRQKLLQIAMLDGNKFIRAIAESDIFWDEIVYMEELEGNFTVCDISVPEFHNFIANDIIVHNSYSGGVITEEIVKLPEDVKKNLSVMLIDTMGIYWSMKNPNEKDTKLLKTWNLKPEGFKINLFVPKGYVEEYKNEGIKVDQTLTLPCGELTTDDWNITFGFSSIDSYGIALERIIKAVKGKHDNSYAISDIIKEIENDKKSEQNIKDALVNRFSAAEEWGVFEKKGTPIKELFQPGAISVIDVSRYMSVSMGWSVRSMLLGMIARKAFQERMIARKIEETEIITSEKKKTMPMIWMMIDEAHQFVPSKGSTAASEPLLTLVKQGRQPGISLLLITQRPNKLHEDVLAQSDLIISHRLTAQADLEALRGIMQTYMLEDIEEYINTLPRQKGSAIILDDNSERIFTVQVRPRVSWHAGGSSVAIKEKGLFE